MGHLSPTDLIDVIEGVGAPAAMSHAGRCAACREAMADLKATLQVAADVDMPEPSPLFWDHFSNRVRAAVADQPRPGFAAEPGRSRWIGWSAGRLAVVGVLAILLIAVVIDTRARWSGEPGLAPSAPPAVASMASNATEAAGAGLAVTETSATPEDASLALVADLSQGLDWDQTADAGIMVKSGSVDSAIAQLSATERVELAKLLESQIKHTSS